jgi:hypothetical protein
MRLDKERAEILKRRYTDCQDLESTILHHPRLFRSIPTWSVPPFVALCEKVVKGYKHAAPYGKRQIIKNLLAIPSRFLRKPEGLTADQVLSPADFEKFINTQLRSGVLLELDPMSEPETGIPSQKRKGKRYLQRQTRDQKFSNLSKQQRQEALNAALQDEHEARILHRAEYLAHVNCGGKASKCLGQPRISAQQLQRAKDSTYALEQLRQLHPPCDVGPSAFETPPKVGDFSSRSLSITALFRVIMKAPRQSAPGRSGWTIELLRSAWDRSKVFRDAFTLIVQDIMNNELDNELRTFFRSSTLVAIPKLDDGVRPIAMGELFLKLASSCAVAKIDGEQMSEFFGGLQYGVGAKNGAEFIIHETRRLLHENPDYVLLTIDAKNAFNSPHRCFLEQALLNTPIFAPLFNLFYLEYGAPGHLYFKEHVLQSFRGVRQGSVTGSIFFSILIQYILAPIQQRYSTSCIIRAYLDDIIVLVHKDSLVRVFNDIEQALDTVGLSVKRGKCQIYLNRTASTDRTFPNGVAVSKDGAKVLGAYVGTDLFVLSQLVACCNAFSVIFERLLRVKNLVGFPIVRRSVAFKLQFLLRAHEPRFFSGEDGIAEKFDADILETVADFAKSTKFARDSLQARLVHLSAEHGGLGIPSMVELLQVAYQSSVEWAEFRRPQFVRQRYDENGAPCSPVPLGAAPAKQKSRSAKIHLANAEALKQTDPAVKRNLEIASQPYASTWMDEMAIQKGLSNEMDLFAAYLRLRLMIYAVERQGDCSACGYHWGTPCDGFYHLIGCALRSGRSITYVHDGVKVVLGHSVRLAGGICRVEPRNTPQDRAGDDTTRPDIYADFGGAVELFDIRSITANSKSNRDTSLADLARNVCRQKRKHHEAYARERGVSAVQAVPFFIGGYFSKEGRDIVDRIIARSGGVLNRKVTHATFAVNMALWTGHLVLGVENHARPFEDPVQTANRTMERHCCEAFPGNADDAVLDAAEAREAAARRRNYGPFVRVPKDAAAADFIRQPV